MIDQPDHGVATVLHAKIGRKAFEFDGGEFHSLFGLCHTPATQDSILSSGSILSSWCFAFYWKDENFKNNLSSRIDGEILVPELESE